MLFLNIALVSALAQKANASTQDSFLPGLGGRAFQESNWVNSQLDVHDVSLRQNFEQIEKEFAGHRHDSVLLAKYRNRYKSHPSRLTGFEQSVAVICFLGLPYGERASYTLHGGERDFGQREYWDFASKWPKHPSSVDYWCRASLFTIIGGNIDLRFKAIQHYLSYFPKDKDFCRIAINVKLYMHPLYRKMKDGEWKQLASEAGDLYKKNQKPSFLYCYFNAQCQLAKFSKLKSDHVLAVSVGEAYLKACVDPIDRIEVPAIMKTMKYLREQVGGA